MQTFTQHFKAQPLATAMMNQWNPAFAKGHIAFEQLAQVSQWLDFSNWPTCDYLNSLLSIDLTTASGEPLRFAAQDTTLPYPELYYEQRIFQHGLIATRANWHDFFNALMWQQYPQTKLAINALHAVDIQAYGLKRTAQRNALTIFDESGIIIVASQRELLALIQAFAWDDLFKKHANVWGKSIKSFIIGHALCEKLLQPFIGMTAHALLVEVNTDFFTASLEQQQALLDAIVAKTLNAGYLASPKQLNPVPVLGIPHWWPEQSNAFYQNKAYFRSRSSERCCDIIQSDLN